MIEKFPLHYSLADKAKYTIIFADIFSEYFSFVFINLLEPWS